MLNLMSNEIKDFVYYWIQTKEKPDDDIMDVNDYNALEEELAKAYMNEKNIYECDVEESNTAKL